MWVTTFGVNDILVVVACRTSSFLSTGRNCNAAFCARGAALWRAAQALTQPLISPHILHVHGHMFGLVPMLENKAYSMKPWCYHPLKPRRDHGLYNSYIHRSLLRNVWWLIKDIYIIISCNNCLVTLTLFGVFDIHMQAIGEYCILLLCVNVYTTGKWSFWIWFCGARFKVVLVTYHFFTHF